MATATPPPSSLDFLARTVENSAVPMSPDTAQYLLSLRLSASDQQRFSELAAKTGGGTLTTQEQAELDEYRRFGRLMEFLQLRARIALKQATRS